MSNHYFQFKQFIVHQEHCAMKVCTDACLFGAWVAELLKNRSMPDSEKTGLRILDIGAGTGLLSLMVAQEINCTIDAVEIDTAAAQQAAENFLASRFAPRLTLIENDIRQWTNDRFYDCIISNPPFFENDLKSPDQKRNLALHSAALGLEELMEIISNRLKQAGVFALLLPYHRKEEMMALAAKKGFRLYASASIKQTPKHPYFRSFLAFAQNVLTPSSEEIVIRENGVYTERFKDLLKAYYLAL